MRAYWWNTCNDDGENKWAGWQSRPDHINRPTEIEALGNLFILSEVAGREDEDDDERRPEQH